MTFVCRFPILQDFIFRPEYCQIRYLRAFSWAGRAFPYFSHLDPGMFRMRCRSFCRCPSHNDCIPNSSLQCVIGLPDREFFEDQLNLGLGIGNSSSTLRVAYNSGDISPFARCGAGVISGGRGLGVAYKALFRSPWG